MYVQLICKDLNEKEMNELYEVLGALCEREGVQIEDRGASVEILVCPQGKIVVTEDDMTMVMTANTRHAGAGFHAFVVDLFKDIEEEVPGEYELIDDLEYANDEDFHRLHHVYENELDYIRKLLLTDPAFRQKNYLYDETYFLPMEKENRVLTSIGDMDRDTFMHKELHDLMDAFYVWNDWDRDARFYRNAALTLLAKEGVGAYTNMNEQTKKVANEVCDDLEIAHEKDPELPLPVKEYTELVDLLGRENKLKDAPKMEKDAIQYRTEDVYHLFDDARIVAPGAAERSYDPITKSVNLMAPYTDDGQWSWLIQASTHPDIVTNRKALEEQEPELVDGKSIWFDDWMEDGYYVLEAMLRYDNRTLYFHDVAVSEREIPYLKQCVRQSGFMSE